MGAPCALLVLIGDTRFLIPGVLPCILNGTHVDVRATVRTFGMRESATLHPFAHGILINLQNVSRFAYRQTLQFVSVLAFYANIIVSDDESAMNSWQ